MTRWAHLRDGTSLTLAAPMPPCCPRPPRRAYLGACLVLGALVLVGCGTSGGRPSNPPAGLVISASGDSYRIGPYSLDLTHSHNATPAGAEAALGHDDTCRVTAYASIATWQQLGVSGNFETLGAFGRNGKVDPHGTGCEYRAQVQPDSMSVNGPRWDTVRGLRVGDSVGRLYRLYPQATYHSGFGPERGGWWLQTATLLPFPGAPPMGSLIAYVSGGKVVALGVHIGAEGE